MTFKNVKANDIQKEKADVEEIGWSIISIVDCHYVFSFLFIVSFL